MPLLCVLAIKGQFPLMDSTWTHERHLSTQDIKQLGQFIQIDPAQKATNAGNARIMLQLHVLLKFLHKISPLFEIGICVGDHRAKFEHAEMPATQPDHFSAVEYTTSIIKF